MAEYTNREYVDMLKVLGACNDNAHAVERLYRERFSNRRHPDHKTIQNVETRIVETGCIAPKRSLYAGRPRSLTCRQEEQLLQNVENNPTISTRFLSRIRYHTQSSVHRCLRRYNMYRYQLQSTEVFNHHNLDYWHYENPHIMDSPREDLRALDMEDKLVFFDQVVRGLGREAILQYNLRYPPPADCDAAPTGTDAAASGHASAPAVDRGLAATIQLPRATSDSPAAPLGSHGASTSYSEALSRDSDVISCASSVQDCSNSYESDCDDGFTKVASRSKKRR
ncbi:hypothetical protein ILUMI_09599 [Ignelater luminosus]|uniref:DUF4817 domain-containing protein n=1 Tax=Ignelater luminosus TaxID=2038154 RepID=A0A8K0GEC5_IGNLU|nr:hypothetical protein ILUMI_09599 [Ignelater luminosus]